MGGDGTYSRQQTVPDIRTSNGKCMLSECASDDGFQKSMLNVEIVSVGPIHRR